MFGVFEVWLDCFVSVDELELFHKLVSGLDINSCDYLGYHILESVINN